MTAKLYHRSMWLYSLCGDLLVESVPWKILQRYVLLSCLFIILFFCLAAALRLNSGTAAFRSEENYKCKVSSVVRSNQWIPLGKIWLFNTIMYSIYGLKGYKSEAVASRRRCFSLLGDCGEAGAYAFSGCVIAVLSFELICASGKWQVRFKVRWGINISSVVLCLLSRSRFVT